MSCRGMDPLLAKLRAAAEPTRMRVLALTAYGTFCVMELTEILGQSQPRLSRHLKQLCDCGLLTRVREGANVWFTLPPPAQDDLARGLIARLPADDPVLENDRRQARRVLAERARIASESFRSRGADWDEMRALGLPAADVEAALLRLLSNKPLGRLLDVGTGTGRILEVLAPHFSAGVGIDASKAMLALARTRLAGTPFAHCAIRQADMYRLPEADASFDTVVLHMVLHHAEEPAKVIAEAGRVLRPGGRMLVVDLAPHPQDLITTKLAHRWPGFDGPQMRNWLQDATLRQDDAVMIDGPITTCLWLCARPADAASSGPTPAR